MHYHCAKAHLFMQYILALTTLFTEGFDIFKLLRISSRIVLFEPGQFSTARRLFPRFFLRYNEKIYFDYTRFIWVLIVFFGYVLYFSVETAFFSLHLRVFRCVVVATCAACQRTDPFNSKFRTGHETVCSANSEKLFRGSQ